MKIIKRLFPYFKPYKGTIIMTLIVGVALSGITLGSAYLVKKIVDDIFVQKNPHMLVLAPFIIIGLYVVGGVLRFTHMYFLRYTGDVIAIDLRNELQAKYTSLNLDFYAANSTGSLISKNINDVIQVQMGLSLLADAVREPVNLVAILGTLFYINWKLTLLVMVSAPILIIASKSIGQSVRKYSFIQQKIWEDFTSVLKESLDGIRIIKAFNLERHMADRFQDTTTKILAVRRKILSREELAGPVFELLGACTLSGILYYAGYQVIRGESTAGTFMQFVFLLFSLQNPIKKLQDAHVRIQHTVAASQRIFADLDLPTTVRDPEDDGRASVEWPTDWQEIEFKDVHFSYKETPVLRGIDLKVKRGDVVAIVGASGAGKTTLVNLLPRFYDVTNGQIIVGGVEIRDMKVKDLRAHIGLVTQDVFLFNESIRDNVLGGTTGEITKMADSVNRAIDAAHAGDFVSRLPHQLDTVVGERGSQLSGGERQRISIARALFRNTPVLILDEATSSLDSQSEKIVQTALDDLMVGRTTFVIAHRLSTIQKATRILVLSEGRIVEQGNHQELLIKQGAYHRLHISQFGQGPQGGTGREEASS